MINALFLFFDKHDWLAHLLLGFVLMFAGLNAAIIGCILVELVQIDILGIKGRMLDTCKDVLFDGIGITAFILIM